MSTLKIRKVKGLYGIYENGKLISDTDKNKGYIENLWLEFENHRAVERYLKGKLIDLADETSELFGLSDRVVLDTIEYLAGKSN